MGTYEKSEVYLRGSPRFSKKKSEGFQKEGLGKAKLLNFILTGLKAAVNALQYLLVFNFFMF